MKDSRVDWWLWWLLWLCRDFGMGTVEFSWFRVSFSLECLFGRNDLSINLASFRVYTCITDQSYC